MSAFVIGGGAAEEGSAVDWEGGVLFSVQKRVVCVN